MNSHAVLGLELEATAYMWARELTEFDGLSIDGAGNRILRPNVHYLGFLDVQQHVRVLAGSLSDNVRLL